MWIYIYKKKKKKLVFLLQFTTEVSLSLKLTIHGNIAHEIEIGELLHDVMFIPQNIFQKVQMYY